MQLWSSSTNASNLVLCQHFWQYGNNKIIYMNDDKTVMRDWYGLIKGIVFFFSILRFLQSSLSG